ncbi:MAG: hypothetical protein OES46_12665 [Gammaproteobacteria bacterium]|nr:hypothetical protein [Gammaproteobacteria bacterium]
MKTLLTRSNTYRVLPIVLAFVCGVLLGTAQGFAGESKEESVTASADASASGSGRIGKTVFVGVSQFGRKKKAAKGMTKLHEEFAQEGWTVVGVAIYTENQDLEGFFVTYVKE